MKYKVRAKEISYLEEREIEANDPLEAEEKYTELWESGEILGNKVNITDFVIEEKGEIK